MQVALEHLDQAEHRVALDQVVVLVRLVVAEHLDQVALLVHLVKHMVHLEHPDHLEVLEVLVILGLN